MKTDAQKYLMRIERTQLLLTKIVENNESAKWEDSDSPVADIVKWAEENNYNPMAELYFKGRQAGRVALARQALIVLGKLLEPDEGGPDALKEKE